MLLESFQKWHIYFVRKPIEKLFLKKKKFPRKVSRLENTRRANRSHPSKINIKTLLCMSANIWIFAITLWNTYAHMLMMIIIMMRSSVNRGDKIADCVRPWQLPFRINQLLHSSFRKRKRKVPGSRVSHKDVVHLKGVIICNRVRKRAKLKIRKIRVIQTPKGGVSVTAYRIFCIEVDQKNSTKNLA